MWFVTLKKAVWAINFIWFWLINFVCRGSSILKIILSFNLCDNWGSHAGVQYNKKGFCRICIKIELNLQWRIYFSWTPLGCHAVTYKQQWQREANNKLWYSWISRNYDKKIIKNLKCYKPASILSSDVLCHLWSNSMFWIVANSQTFWDLTFAVIVPTRQVAGCELYLRTWQ